MLPDFMNIRVSLNLGLSEILKFSFPATIPVPRPQLKLPEKLDPEWIAGFTSGDGCFFVNVVKGRNKSGIGVRLGFQITQHIRDKELLKSFIFYFKPPLKQGSGIYTGPRNKNYGHFVCTKFEDNYNKILPFFSQYLIRGTKYMDFLDWVKVAEVMQQKKHLTEEGACFARNN